MDDPYSSNAFDDEEPPVNLTIQIAGVVKSDASCCARIPPDNSCQGSSIASGLSDTNDTAQPENRQHQNQQHNLAVGDAFFIYKTSSILTWGATRGRARNHKRFQVLIWTHFAENPYVGQL